MKIAIYGDSFGSGFGFKLSNNALEKLKYIGKDWTEILSEKYDITNYSEFSSSLVFSASLFEKTHCNYDKVVFLATHPGRITMGNPSKNQPLPHFVNYEYSKMWQHRAQIEGWNTELSSILAYYLYIYHEPYDLLIHNSLIEHVKKTRPDTIMIPNFKNSFNDIIGNTLTDIFEMENTVWKVKYPILDYDLRKCHLTPENNLRLAEKMDTWISGSPVDIRVSDFVQPTVTKENYIFKELPQ